MAKNRKDYAIVVGIQDYPDGNFVNLEAPENDAQAVYDWLVSNTGGRLLKKNVQLIKSSNYKRPFASAARAKPTAERIEKAFKKLDDLARESNDQGLGLKVGRRLYLFFAGHGAAPRANVDEALLLTANVSESTLGENIPGKMYTDWYVRSGYFEEAVLLMDCCREVFAAAKINEPDNPQIIRTGAIDKGVVFYGFATKWSRKARERPFEDGTWHGIFTKALLTGLERAAADKNSRVTAGSLRDYLYNSWKSFLSEQDLTAVDIPKEPQVWIRPQRPGSDSALVFAEIDEPIFFPVQVIFTPHHLGQTARIEDNDFETVDSTTVGLQPWEVDLRRGLYCLSLKSGLEQCFAVDGTGAVNVTF